jgi:hypothetical protein
MLAVDGRHRQNVHPIEQVEKVLRLCAMDIVITNFAGWVMSTTFLSLADMIEKVIKEINTKI